MRERANSTLPDYQEGNIHAQPVSPLDSGEFDALLKRGLNFKPFIRAVRRRALIAAGIASVFAAYAMYKSSTSVQLYQSGFQILVEPISKQGSFSDPAAVTRSSDIGAPTDITGVDYPTQLEVLRSTDLLDRIVEVVNQEYPGFSVNQLRRGLTVERVGETRLTQTKLIAVSYSDVVPDRVDAVIAAAADQYLRYSLEDRKTRFSEGISFIEQQLPQLQDRVQFLQDQRQQLQQQYEFVNPDNQGEFIAIQMNELSSLQMQTTRELQEQRTLYRRLQDQLELTPDEAIASSTLSEDPKYQQLLADIQQVDQEIAVESVRFSPSSPVVQSLSQRRENLSNLLSQETQRILGQDVDLANNNARVLAFQNRVRLDLIQQMVNTGNNIQLLEARNRAVFQDRQQMTSDFDRLPVVVRRYNEIEQQLGIANRTLEQLLTQRELLAVESAQREVPWEIVSEINLKRDANGNPVPLPQSNKEMIVSIGLGILVGIGGAILYDRLKNVFYTTEDIQDNVELPVLGIIPFYEGEQVLKGFEHSNEHGRSSSDVNFVSEFDPQLMSRKLLFSEAFSNLYAGLQFVLSKHSIRSIVISSAEPSDGKSMVASQLADMSSSVGVKTLLVDANLYHPSLHHRFRLPNNQGLAELIKDEVPFEQIIQQVPTSSNLYLLSAGQKELTSSRLFASKRMQTLMDTFEREFDFVIYDTPHLLGLTDASFICSKADGMLLVNALEKTKRDVFMQVLNDVKNYELPILGIVANHVKARSKVTYGYRNTIFKKKKAAMAET